MRVEQIRHAMTHDKRNRPKDDPNEYLVDQASYKVEETVEMGNSYSDMIDSDR